MGWVYKESIWESPFTWKRSGKWSWWSASECRRVELVLVKPCQPHTPVIAADDGDGVFHGEGYSVSDSMFGCLSQVHVRHCSLRHGTACGRHCSYFHFVYEETEGLNSFPLGTQLMREGRSLAMKFLLSAPHHILSTGQKLRPQICLWPVTNFPAPLLLLPCVFCPEPACWNAHQRSKLLPS